MPSQYWRTSCLWTSSAAQISRMTHELRTPLNSILALRNLQMGGEHPARGLECVQHILKGRRRRIELYWITWNKSCAAVFVHGICSSGMGRAWKSLRQGIASQRAQARALFRRALSVAIPVLAYI